jgi:hypothetical protein
MPGSRPATAQVATAELPPERPKCLGCLHRPLARFALRKRACPSRKALVLPGNVVDEEDRLLPEFITHPACPGSRVRGGVQPQYWIACLSLQRLGCGRKVGRGSRSNGVARSLASGRKVPMHVDGVSVLLIGQSARGFSHIIHRLAKSGCHCLLAHSYHEASKLLATGSFELVLGASPFPHDGIRSLASALAGSRASIFCAYPVEASCWWVPVLTNGIECLGAPALRPAEFGRLLDRLIDDTLGPQNPATCEAATPPSPSKPGA